MQLDYFAIFAASLLQFLFGAVWYTPVFGKKWGQIHGFDKVPKEEQEKMMKKMGPLLATQFVVTVVTTVVLAMFMTALPSDWNPYGIAAFFWIGFIVPTEVSAVIFGGTEPKWICTKLSIMAGGSLGCMMIAAAVLHGMM